MCGLSNRLVDTKSMNASVVDGGYAGLLVLDLTDTFDR